MKSTRPMPFPRWSAATAIVWTSATGLPARDESPAYPTIVGAPSSVVSTTT